MEISSICHSHTQDVKVVKWHPNGDNYTLASGGFDMCLKLWRYDEDFDDWTNIQNLNHHTDTIWGILVNIYIYI